MQKIFLGLYNQSLLPDLNPLNIGWQRLAMSVWKKSKIPSLPHNEHGSYIKPKVIRTIGSKKGCAALPSGKS
jgi:hypothetical protein